MQITDWLKQAAVRLQASGSESPKLDAELLLADVLQKDRTWLFTWSDKLLDATAVSQADQRLQRRLQGEPVAYILGYRDFWSLRLAVSPATLIPRPDTETLVEWALELPLPANAQVIDMGTGTGAIALALASEQPGWHVTGVDYSDDSVALAQQNARSNQLTTVRFFQSDWFSQVSGHFDLIVSNPPYIDASDPHLSQGDVRFEPASALVAEDHGMADIQQLIEQSQHVLNDNGWLLFEHGYQQAELVAAALRAAGFADVSSRVDLAGNPRVTGGRWPVTRLA
nr:peptide chain release factor N(5)-glutamine methyltransferase [Oceanobacter mangrovi]